MSSNKVNFTDSEHTTLLFSSAWRVAATSKSIECQTTPELYQFEEAEMQTGKGTDVMQAEVSAKFSGKTLIEFLSKTKKQTPQAVWEDRIQTGTITVNMEVVTDPHFVIAEDYFIEFVDYRKDAAVRRAVRGDWAALIVIVLCCRLKRNHPRRARASRRVKATLVCYYSCAEPRALCRSS